MSENSANTTIDESQKIDVITFIEDFLRWLRRKWWIVVLLTVLGGAAFYFRTSTTYAPNYTAQATVSVKAVSVGTMYDNSAASAEQLGKVFPYILTSGVLEDIVAQDMGTDSIPGTISVTNIEGTNLLTIKVSADDPDTAYNLMQSFIENYGEVAQYVVGQSELTIIDDKGVPETVGTQVVVRGSAMKGAFLGFVFGILIVLLYMATYRTVRTGSDLRKTVNAPYLGTLPIYHKRLRKKKKHEGINILEEDAQEDYVESVRVIRTRLERQLESRGIKTIMVTSSIPGEGKSTVAANLAISLGMQGKKVVLIDCDLRNPSSQSVFNIEGEQPGLVSVLNGKTKLDDALYKIDNDGMELYCLFGSAKGTQKVEILGKKAMGQLLEALEKTADVVILDTPPTAMLVDASILVKYVKSAIYVVMSDYARRQYIMRGLEEIQGLGVHIDGCVLNGAKDSSYSHRRNK